MWTIFKVFIELLQYASVFYFDLSVLRHVDLSSLAGIETTPLALEGEVLTTGLPEKSQFPYYLSYYIKSLSWALC